MNGCSHGYPHASPTPTHVLSTGTTGVPRVLSPLGEGDPDPWYPWVTRGSSRRSSRGRVPDAVPHWAQIVQVVAALAGAERIAWADTQALQELRHLDRREPRPRPVGPGPVLHRL